jgi:hypothetical protein
VCPVVVSATDAAFNALEPMFRILMIVTYKDCHHQYRHQYQKLNCYMTTN